MPRAEPDASVTWVASPNALPPLPPEGRLALLDVAFAHQDGYERITLPFIERAGKRLAGWIDHHAHPAWIAWERDARFTLVPRHRARACPELITPERVARLGRLEHVLAHADFDGLLSAAKLLLGGEAPYPEADQDARAVDSPGRGEALSPRGLRLARALDQMSLARPETRLALLDRVLEALLQGRESPALAAELDSLAGAREAEEPRLLALAAKATRPHPEVLLLRCPDNLPSAQRKHLLRALEAEARVAILAEPKRVTLATFHDEPPDGLSPGLDLTQIAGLRGIPGYAYGGLSLERALAEVLRLLRD